MPSLTSTRTLYIPHYQVLDGLPHPPPHWLVQLFRQYGIGDVERIDIAPRNVQTESAEWADIGLSTDTDFMAFVHIDTHDADPEVLSIIDDPATSYQLDWGNDIAQSGLNFGSGYWIVLPSTSSGVLTHTAASYHPIEGDLDVGIVSLRRQASDPTAPPLAARSLITAPYATGCSIVMPSWQTCGLYRYDMLHGECNPFHPYADASGRVAYTESEFVILYGVDLGYIRFRVAPDAAPLQISMPPCTVYITTLLSGISDMDYYDLNDLIDLTTPLLNTLIGMAMQCPGVVDHPHAFVQSMMDPPRGFQNLDPDSETGTAIFDVQITIHECPIVVAQGLSHTVASLNALIRPHVDGGDYISFNVPSEISDVSRSAIPGPLDGHDSVIAPTSMAIPV